MSQGSTCTSREPLSEQDATKVSTQVSLMTCLSSASETLGPRPPLISKIGLESCPTPERLCSKRESKQLRSPGVQQDVHIPMQRSFPERCGELSPSSLCESRSNQGHAGDQCSGIPHPSRCWCHSPGQAIARITLLKEKPATGEVRTEPEPSTPNTQV